MNNFNFIVGDYTGPCITLRTTRISFNKKCMELLKYPSFVNIGFDIDNKLMAVRSAQKDSDIPTYKFLLTKSQNSAFIISIQIIREISKMLRPIGLKKEERIIPEFDDKNGILIADFNKRF